MGDSQQAAGARSGAVDAYSARILAYRASHSKPLQAGANVVGRHGPRKVGLLEFEQSKESEYFWGRKEKDV